MLTLYLTLAAALCSVAVAIFHIYVIVQGPWAYRYFGAGEAFASMAEQGSWIPAAVTWCITIVFLIFAGYYLSAAGLLPQLPLFKIGIIAIAAIYTLRGAIVLPGLVIGMKLSAFDVWSSLISLAIGLLHCAAAWLTLRALPAPAIA